MEIIIRKVQEKDLEYFFEFSVKLSHFNRNNHNIQCKYDDYDLVLKSIREKAELTFKTRSEDVRIFIAEVNKIPVGYAIGSIYYEKETADNGTGKIGLFDELYVDDSKRGIGIGNKLIDKVIYWMKTRKITRIKLHAYSWNKNAKILYEKLGFNEYAVSYEKFI